MTADFSRASDRRSISNNLVEFVFFAGTKIWTCELHFVLCFRWWRCVSMFVVFTANVDNHRKYLTDKSFFRWEKKKQQQQIPFHKKCPKVSWPTNGRASFRTPFLLLTIRSAQAQRLQPPYARRIRFPRLTDPGEGPGGPSPNWGPKGRKFVS